MSATTLALLQSLYGPSKVLGHSWMFLLGAGFVSAVMLKLALHRAQKKLFSFVTQVEGLVADTSVGTKSFKEVVLGVISAAENIVYGVAKAEASPRPSTSAYQPEPGDVGASHLFVREQWRERRAGLFSMEASARLLSILPACLVFIGVLATAGNIVELLLRFDSDPSQWRAMDKAGATFASFVVTTLTPALLGFSLGVGLVLWNLFQNPEKALRLLSERFSFAIDQLGSEVSPAQTDRSSTGEKEATLPPKLIPRNPVGEMEAERPRSLHEVLAPAEAESESTAKRPAPPRPPAMVAPAASNHLLNESTNATEPAESLIPAPLPVTVPETSRSPQPEKGAEPPAEAVVFSEIEAQEIGAIENEATASGVDVPVESVDVAPRLSQPEPPTAVEVDPRDGVSNKRELETETMAAGILPSLSAKEAATAKVEEKVAAVSLEEDAVTETNWSVTAPTEVKEVEGGGEKLSDTHWDILNPIAPPVGADPALDPAASRSIEEQVAAMWDEGSHQNEDASDESLEDIEVLTSDDQPTNSEIASQTSRIDDLDVEQLEEDFLKSVSFEASEMESGGPASAGSGDAALLTQLQSELEKLDQDMWKASDEKHSGSLSEPEWEERRLKWQNDRQELLQKIESLRSHLTPDKAA